MHESIRNNLESLLDGSPSAGEVRKHLASCGDCAGTIAAMRSQTTLLRSLRPAEEFEPAVGFYARVMQRIEERAKDSIWAVFVYSPIGKRFALASLSLALVLGSYVVAQEKLDGHLTGDTSVAQQVHYDAPMNGSLAQQRDAVLENFAAHAGEFK